MVHMFCRFGDRSWAMSVLLAAAMLAWAPLSQAQTVTIGALVAGQVLKVYVKPGQKVVKGQLLLEIDDERWQAKVIQRQAELKQLQLQLADAKVELDKQLDLFDRTVTAKRALDRAQLAYDVLEQKVNAATAKLHAVQAWGKYYHVKAPFNASVGKIYAPQGTTVYKENTPLIELKR
jgi:RND family efflux transporter MFP subunit